LDTERKAKFGQKKLALSKTNKFLSWFHIFCSTGIHVTAALSISCCIFLILGENRAAAVLGILGMRTSLIIQKKKYIKWCKGCANDFSFRTGCGLRNELRTAAVQQAQDLQPTDPSIPRERRPKNCNLAGHVLHSVNRKIIIV